jgi:uncharacterized protein YqeY
MDLDTPADQWRARLRQSLLAARKVRDATRVSVLRCALSAIDNAEAPEAAAAPVGPVVDEGTIAGAVRGLGAGEAARRDLSAQEVRDVVVAELTERTAAADTFDALGEPDRAASLRAEVAVLAELLAQPA